MLTAVSSSENKGETKTTRTYTDREVQKMLDIFTWAFCYMYVNALPDLPWSCVHKTQKFELNHVQVVTERTTA